MSELALVIDNSELVKKEALSWPDRAKTLKVKDNDSYLQGGDLLKGIKALRQKIAELFDPHIKRAYDAHKALVREKADAEMPLTEAERIIKGALVAYTEEQERKRRDEERRLAEEARRREEDRRVAEAAALEQAGEYDEAVAVLAEAETAPTPVVVLASATPKVQGISYRTVWRFRIIDAKKIPDEYKVPDETKIGAVVRAMKGETRIAGIEVYEDRIAAASGR